MELKRIVASDTRSATERATVLFGQDVLIISNHRVNGQTELVVAIDLDEHETRRLQVAAWPAEKDFRSHFVQIEGSASLAGGMPLLVSEPSPIQQKEADARDYLRSREVVDLIRAEMTALRREFSISQQVSGWQTGLNLAPEIQPLLALLAEAGLSTGLRTLLLDTVKNMRSQQEALHAIRDQLCDALGRVSVALPQKGIHLIAGPSGAGKTLMAARLASQLASTLGPQHVTIISYQDLRAGAWSQTQMLSAQMGIDCFRAPDPESLGLLLAEMSHRSLILIDTPGVQMTERIEEVLALCPACVCHALVPADASLVTLNRVFQSSTIRWSGLMVSKLDESTQPWPLIEYFCASLLGISAASDGNSLTSLKFDLTPQALVETAIDNLPIMPRSDSPVLRHRQVEGSSSSKTLRSGRPLGLV